MGIFDNHQAGLVLRLMIPAMSVSLQKVKAEVDLGDSLGCADGETAHHCYVRKFF